MEGNEIGTQVNDNIQKLIDQLADIKFEGMVMCAVMLVLCLVLCLEGYQIYRLALLLIGLAMGFVTMHSLLDTAGVVLTSEQRLMRHIYRRIHPHAPEKRGHAGGYAFCRTGRLCSDLRRQGARSPLGCGKQ